MIKNDLHQQTVYNNILETTYIHLRTYVRILNVHELTSRTKHRHFVYYVHFREESTRSTRVLVYVVPTTAVRWK